jgi:hypothetical protein
MKVALDPTPLHHDYDLLELPCLRYITNPPGNPARVQCPTTYRNTANRNIT